MDTQKKDNKHILSLKTILEPPIYNLRFYFKDILSMYKNKFFQKFLTLILLFNFLSLPLWAASTGEDMPDLDASVSKVGGNQPASTGNDDEDEPSSSISVDLGAAASAPASPTMRFKLGFEFQEISGLCPWALDNYSYQKKPIFFFRPPSPSQEGPLWHVVIDTNDIEFVTRPYTNPSQLEGCVVTIVESFKLLKKCLEDKRECTFAEWIASVEAIGNILKTPDFEFFKDETITRPDPWSPRFSPQATIQHPLEDTIPLFFSLFASDSSPSMATFVPCLPFSKRFLSIHKDGTPEELRAFMRQYKSKINGLVFLHALTIYSMSSFSASVDADLLREVMDNSERYYQADVKMKLTLMSRRPFSSLFASIPSEGKPVYSDYFQRAMVTENDEFGDICEIPRSFSRADYAEQYFDATGRVIDLRPFLHLFTEDFVASNRDAITALLQKGVVSIHMIKKLKPEAKEQRFSDLTSGETLFFERALRSVDDPRSVRRFTLDPTTLHIVATPAIYDVLSPPDFLDSDDSMGAIKDTAFEKYQDARYGEAITEVRNISGFGEWFFNKMGIPAGEKRMFLRVPDDTLIPQALKLFEFLDRFSRMPEYTEDILQKMIEIILGEIQ